MNLGTYLANRLSEAGIKDIFGVPGDFCLALLNSIEACDKINYVGCCNELNAAYAADGYARIQGIGAVVTTYAVGELSAVNGVAGSFAESVPVVKLVGVPSRQNFITKPLLHHTLGDYMAPMSMYKSITATQTMLMDPNTCAKEIDRVLHVCLQMKKPVYIGVPSDMVNVEIPLTEPSVFGAPAKEVSKPEPLAEAVDEICKMVAKAKKPLFLPGIELIRRGLTGVFQKLTEKTKIPYITMLLGKGLCREDHDNFIGMYAGARSRPEVKDFVDSSDCIVILGEKFTDFNTGGFSSDIAAHKRIVIEYSSISIHFHSYNDVYIHDVLDALVAKMPASTEPQTFKKARDHCVNRRASYAPDMSSKLTMARLFACLANRLPPQTIVLAETGAALFSASETMLPEGALFIGQSFYGSIGYTVGATLGVCTASKGSRPVFTLVGDGSFQLTCQEISTVIRQKLPVTIILINNDGYTIERVIHDNVYNDVQPWKYSDLPPVFLGPKGTVCNTEGDLAKALDKREEDPEGFHFIEVILDRWDCNQLLKDAGKSMAKINGLI